MREDDRNRWAEKLADELLDAALSNHHGAEPKDGLEDRILANLRQQPRAARPASWNLAPVIMAGAILVTLLAIDHLVRRSATRDVALSGADALRGGADLTMTGQQAKAGRRDLTADVVKIVKRPAAAPSSSRRRSPALSSNPGGTDEQTQSGFRLEDVRIAEIRLDDIVISGDERRE